MSLPSERKFHRLCGFALISAWFGVLIGWRPLGLLFAAAAVHELAHWAVIRMFGGRVQTLRLTSRGAEMRTSPLALSYPQELAAVLAGPGADLLCGAVCSALAAENRMSFQPAGAFWVLGIFNLLPLRTLDGGAAVRLTVSWLAGPEAGERAVSCVSLASAVCLTVLLAVLMVSSGGNLWLAPAAVGAGMTAIRELPLRNRQIRGQNTAV